MEKLKKSNKLYKGDIVLNPKRGEVGVCLGSENGVTKVENIMGPKGNPNSITSFGNENSPYDVVKNKKSKKLAIKYVDRMTGDETSYLTSGKNVEEAKTIAKNK